MSNTTTPTSSSSKTPSLTILHLTTLYAQPPTSLPASSLTDILSEHESSACLLFTSTETTGDADLLRLFYAGYLIALLLIDEQDEARYLTHRFPPTLSASDPTLHSAAALLRAVWSNEYTPVYATVQYAEWPDALRPLLVRYLEHFRTRTFHLLSRAYTSIPPSLAATYLGLRTPPPPSTGIPQQTSTSTSTSPSPSDPSDQAVVENLVRRGWRWDAEKGVLLPRPVVAAERTGGGDGGAGKQRADVEAGMGRLVQLVGVLGE
ncbi:MAG: hypothetical protein M1833_004381 [Piccolia ochrophora]|nr:MAG: hypothetical protein M1833_004381 [Piccolia ochrophora]